MDNVRLLCRAHNQHAAEASFGVEFMRHKREQAREGTGRTQAAPDTKSEDRDVVPCLRALGFRADQARRAAKECESLPEDATLEQRIRYALKLLAPPHRRWEPAGMIAT